MHSTADYITVVHTQQKQLISYVHKVLNSMFLLKDRQKKNTEKARRKRSIKEKEEDKTRSVGRVYEEEQEREDDQDDDENEK